MKGRPLNSIILIWTLQALCVPALHLEGEFPDGSDFAPYLGKFCFHYDSTGENVGLIQFELKPRTYSIPKEMKEHMEMFLLIFDDEDAHWQRARRDWYTSTCSEKKAMASLVTRLNVSYISTTQPIDYKINIKEKLRPRFWYFTLVSCEKPDHCWVNNQLVSCSKLGVIPDLPTPKLGVWEGQLRQEPMSYKLHLQNIAFGWQSEFSSDHTDMLGVCIAFCGAFVFVAVYTHMESKKQEVEDHPLVRMLSVSHALSFGSALSFAMYYAMLSQDGWQCSQLRFLGVLFGVMMVSTVFLTIMMVGEGWAEMKGFACLVKEKIRHVQMAFALAGACAFCELHDEFVVDQSTKLYSYQSVPGGLALLMKVAMFCWFWRSTQRTLDGSLGHVNQTFYKVFLWSLTLWFLSLPVIVMMAWFVNPWQRYKLVAITDLLSKLAIQALLSFLLCGHLSPLSKLEVSISSKSSATEFEVTLMDHKVGILPATGP
jgi:hypothetical protein